MSTNTPMEMAGFYSIAKITGDNRHMGEHDDGYLVYYNYNLRYGYQGCASFPTLDEAKAFAASKTPAEEPANEGNKMSTKETPQQNARGTECTRAECPNTNGDCHACKYAKPIKLERPYFADFDAELFDGMKTKMAEAFHDLGHADSDWWVEGGLITFSFLTEDDRAEFLEEIGITLSNTEC